MLRRLLKPLSTPRTERGHDVGRFAGVLRVACFSALVSFAFTAFTVRSVYGEMQETALRVGRDMVRLWRGRWALFQPIPLAELRL